ncbi:hypothetical protein K402DRAFT_389407 [Aulographum hederae CBS 113979]|uniref:Uncharacterized protein n=1 Tax=Aulographum hederae CBS 113979 TaxID=1176131 RepID=A0A6G1HDS5_9PEZI|nr:hypothetical protein K402DRAFT_389407 [Aulographum hederae CBS 113979]
MPKLQEQLSRCIHKDIITSSYISCLSSRAHLFEQQNNLTGRSLSYRSTIAPMHCCISRQCHHLRTGGCIADCSLFTD